MQWEMALRIFLACLCGGFIGYERNSQNKQADVRTHAIVSLGSALAMIVSIYAFDQGARADVSRIAAQVVSGVGFLGAGIIFVEHGTVTGLTTAAGLWATAIIGLALGAGMYDVGLFSTFLVFGMQLLFHNKRIKRIANENVWTKLSDKEDEE